MADFWSVDAAIYAAAVALVAIGFLAIRRARLPLWKRLIVLLAEFILVSLVLSLQLIAHG